MKRTITILAAGALTLALAACSGGTSGTGSTAASGDASGTSPATESVTWKFAFSQTEEHPQYVAAAKFAEDLAAATDGRYQIEIYPNDLLGSQSEVMENITQGTVEFSTVFGPVLEQMNADFAVFDMPYMFDSKEAQDQVFGDADLLAPLFASLEESKNIKVLTALYIGSRNIYNRIKPIVEPADLAGLKIRVPQSDVQLQMIGLMGAVGTPMGLGDIYTALQSGVLDGAENSMVTYDDIKHDEVAPYLSYTQHLMAPDYVVMSAEAFNSMSPEDQQIVLDLMEEYRTYEGELFMQKIEDATAAAEAKGVQFNDANVEAFKELLLPMHEQYITSDYAKELYAAVNEANEAIK